MNLLQRFLFSLVLLLIALPMVAVGLTDLRQGGVFRIKSNSGRFMAVADNGSVVTLDGTRTDQSDLWFVQVLDNNGYIFNLKNLKTFPTSAGSDEALQTTSDFVFHYFKEKRDTFVISWTSDFKNETCLHQNARFNVVKWNAENSNSQWTFEKDDSLTDEQIKAIVQKVFGIVATPEAGKKYRFVNLNHPGHVMYETAEKRLKAERVNPSAFSQIWQLEQSGAQWTLKNLFTDHYADNSINQSVNISTTTSAAPLQLRQAGKYLPYFTIENNNSNAYARAFHFAPQQGNDVVGWEPGSHASHWLLSPATYDEEALQRARNAMALSQSLGGLNEQLSHFFEDKACTRLKAEYKSLDDNTLKDRITATGLSSEFADMAVRIKNDAWLKNAEANVVANALAKDFRVHAYQPHSHPALWSRNPLMTTSFGSYSVLTNPTGITLSTAEVAYVYVDKAPASNTTLKLQLVKGYDSTPTSIISLKEGVNVVYTSNDCHLYVDYIINDTATTLASVSPINIHIEGGRVNGCFDTDRHTNETWKKMRSLKAQGFLADEVFRMRTNHFCFSYNLSQMEHQDDNGGWSSTTGEYQGLTASLRRWDEVMSMELDFLSVERFSSRFNCLLFNASNLGTYATTYGVWMGSSILDYKQLTDGGENGGNLWAVAHEVGHHFQHLFNIAGCLESSNNLWSQIALWQAGTTVGRGDPIQGMLDFYNDNHHWLETNIGKRYQMYWKLWLYFVELGHKPTFFKELFDEFRKNPINQSNANTDFLHFARTCSKIANEDLTDFFTMCGFFRVPAGKHNVSYGDAFYDKYYNLPIITVDKADIDSTLAALKQYPKGGAANLFFLDERIRESAATYPGAPADAKRKQVQANATPGDVKEVGDVGMYTDFAPGRQPEVRPTSVVITDRFITIKGSGAVGYKVYDKNGNLVAIANRNTFFVPEGIDMNEITVKVASGKGLEGDVEVIKDGKVKAPYVATTADTDFNNTAHLLLSTSRSAPEHPYHIALTSDQNYFLTASTTPTADVAQKGKFAFFAGFRDGEYLIYNVDQQRWLGYSDVSQGQNKITFCAELSQNCFWEVVRESNGISFDVKPVGSGNGWNWYGGRMSAHTSMGLYATNDGNSSWTFVLVSLKDQLTLLVQEAEHALAMQGVGYPTSNAPERQILANAIANARSNATPTAAQLDEFKAAYTTYLNSKTHIQLPEDGKVYRIHHFKDRRMITNTTSDENGRTHSIAMTNNDDNTTLWVCQQQGDNVCFASLVGNGYLGLETTTRRGELYATPYACTFPIGTKHGYLSIRTQEHSFSGGNVFLEAVAMEVQGNGNEGWGTDFSFEEVADAAYSLNVRAANNGNYASIMLPFAVKLPKGLTANAAKMGETKVELIPLTTEGTLPAFTPVVLSATEGNKEYRLVPAAAAEQIETGMKGTIQKKESATLDRNANNFYLLRMKNNEAMFNILGTAYIPANRAFFETQRPAAPAATALTIGLAPATVTALERLSPTTPLALPIYDLSGRRVLQPQRGGVYIVGGRCMIFH